MLTARIMGPGVGEGRLAVRDLALLGETLERATMRAAEVLARRRTEGFRRQPAAIGAECRLFLVGFERGSAVARFELGGQRRQGDLFAEVAERAAGIVVETLAQARAGRLAEITNHPEMVAVARELRSLVALRKRGIEKVDLTLRDGVERGAVWDGELAARLQAWMERPPESGERSVRGRLDRLDGHGQLAGSLWEQDGTSRRCAFAPELEPQLAALWRRWVEARGRVSTAGDGIRRLEVTRIRPLEPELDLPSRLSWTARTLDELARDQGVASTGRVQDPLAVGEGEELETDPAEEVLKDRCRRRAFAAPDG